MGNAFQKPKDGTAQGVAKVRHYEALFPPEQRLYLDPYAYGMYPGSILQNWMGAATIDKIYQWMGLVGFVEMITVRTKWLDDGVAQAIQQDQAKQLIILGAGYDTRGFRLNLPDEFKVFEVDQPEVQTKKMANLNWLANNMKDDDSAAKKAITDRMNAKVQFVAVDFNEDSVDDKLKSSDGFETNQLSVVLMEGVTQYIPRESAADTLKKLKTLLASGSTLLITYVDQNTFDDPSKVTSSPRVVGNMIGLASRVGEPWISGWSQTDFASFLKECGYEVVSDTTIRDYNEKYLQPVGRQLEEGNFVAIERFVTAKLL